MLHGAFDGAQRVFGQVLWPAVNRPTNRPKVSQWRSNQHVGHPGSCTETIQKRLRVSQSMLVLLWVCAAMRLGQLLLSGFTS